MLKMLSYTAIGKASDECSVSGDGEGLEIGFNRYLSEALKAAPADTVKLMLTSSVSPCVIVPADGSDNFIYMILPVRLKSYEG